MSESVEQAALRRAGVYDWKVRAEREAAAIIAEVMPNAVGDYPMLNALIAVGWLQGVNVGAHQTLHAAEAAFESVRAEL